MLRARDVEHHFERGNGDNSLNSLSSQDLQTLPRVHQAAFYGVAVLISSEVLGADIWFSFDDSFNPGAGLAVFYADELEFLKSKDAQTLRKIHETKLAFGPGSRVRQ